jgi:prepilin-type N-terminal cleavage/methylation domain-containing protein
VALRPRRGAAAGERGFSLIEVVIGAALLLVVAVGVAPLFTKAMTSNQRGREATEVSSYATSKLEEFMQLPFNSPRLTPFDTNTEKVFKDYFSFQDKVWKNCTDPDDNDPDPAIECPPSSATDGLQWLRTATVRQYQLLFNKTTLTSSLQLVPGNAPLNVVHVKEIDVVIESPREGGPAGLAAEISLRALKAK